MKSAPRTEIKVKKSADTFSLTTLPFTSSLNPAAAKASVYDWASFKGVILSELWSREASAPLRRQSEPMISLIVFLYILIIIIIFCSKHLIKY